MIFVAQRQLGYPWFWIASVLMLALVFSVSEFRLQLLLVLGIGLGVSLNYFIFGFTSGWRQFFSTGRTEGVRSQLVMLMLASLLFTPLIVLQQIGDQSFQGLVRPVSSSVLLGAFIFGLGMQLAGSCSSGTLNRVGQLRPLSILTFGFMFVGGIMGAYYYGEWVNWPTLAPFSFTEMGNGFGILLSVALLFGFYLFFTRLEKRRHHSVNPLFDHQSADRGLNRWHPLLIAAVFLAVLNFAVFWVSGQPWSIASIFTVWSIKFSEWANMGLDWPFWEVMTLYETRIDRPILEDPVSLTSIGVILGALWVTLWHRKPANEMPITPISLVGGITGGLLMGFGATLSYGCNIGAFFSGVASGSLHGWVWIFAAVAGNWVGFKLMAKFNSAH